MHSVIPTDEDRRIARLAAFAIAIHVIESALPSVVPGIKPGLANVITLVVMNQFGWRAAVWVSLLRVLVGSLFLGTFLTPTFVLSLSGAIASLLVLWPLSLTGDHGPGPIGQGVAAALAHTSGQFYMAWLVFIPHPGLLNLLPFLLIGALIFGVVSGIICDMMLNRIRVSST